MPTPRPNPPITIPDSSELEERAKSAEIVKNLGNDYFREGEYKEAAVMYNFAVELNGTQPAYMSNLAATYLKLEDYDLAERAAYVALLHDPRMTKARFRRGLARKATKQLRAAATDFVTILKEDPDCAEAKSELAALQERINNGEHDESNIWQEWDEPTPDARPRALLPLRPLSESESEPEDRPASPDSESEPENLEDHVGNGIPCKHHNRKPLGCAKRKSCVYSHAPDARSFPDTEGRNVCLYFLMGSCKFGERCLYSHDKANLSPLDVDGMLEFSDISDILILRNELEIRHRRYFTKYMGKGPLAPEPLLSLRRAREETKAKEAYATGLVDMFDLLNVSLPESFIIHLTLNKSTDVPGAALSGLRECIDVSRAKTTKKVLSLLSAPDMRGVFITDAGITQRKNADLLAKIVAYARGGGTVVIGGSFKLLEGRRQADLTAAQLEAFFQKGWGLPWKLGSQRPRKTFARNHHTALQAPIPLPESLTLNALHLQGVRADAALYLPTGHSQLDSAKFRASELVETPVVVAEFGKGRLCFISESVAEKPTMDVLLAMFGISR